VKLDEKTRWLLELAARHQRRTSSSFVEFCINLALESLTLRENEEPLSELGDSLWDVDEPDRIMKLALRYPELLDLEEQRIWKVVRECSSFWRRYNYGAVSTLIGPYGFPVDADGVQWNPDSKDDLLLPLVREHWETINAISRGELEASSLPTRELDGRDYAGQEA
jgi:hypothetical protein